MGTDVVWGIARVKDEADIIRPVVEHMLEQVDHVLIADNASTDGTREILEELDVEVIDDPEVGYFQSRQMSALAARAADAGAEWVVPFDADEWWYSPFSARIADLLTSTEWIGASIMTAQLFDHVATGADPDDPNPVTRIQWRRSEAGKLPKVAARTRPRVTIHQGNHDADHGGRMDGLLVVRHFPYRSVEQFVSKVRNGAAAYAATDLPEDQGAHWRDYGRILHEGGPDALADVFRTWFWQARPTRDLVRDPAP